MAALLTAASATAQAPEAQSTLEEIVVTAQRRAERLEDVPIAITAASGATLEAAGITSMEDISMIAPGVQMSRTGVLPQPAIRGISTQLTSTGSENNVAVYVDGFYRPYPRGLDFDLANVAQVTILKGPQGTLFGRNATGGAILVETLSPSLTDSSGRLVASYGRFNDRRLQFYGSTPISDTLAVNLAASGRKSEGYIRDIRGFNTGPVENFNVTAKLLWQPTDDLRVTLGFDTTQTNDGHGLAITYDSVARALVPRLYPGTYIETRPYRTSLTHPLRSNSRHTGGTIKLEYDFGPAKLTSYTRYQYEHDYSSYDLDGAALVQFDQYITELNDAYSQEVNLASTGSGKLSYVLGAFYFYSDSRGKDSYTQSSPTTPFVGSNRAHTGAKAAAAYADVTWEVTDRIFLTGGLRYSHEKKTMLAYTSNISPIVSDQEATFNSVTPRAVIRYELTDDSNVYASFSKGFKSGLIATSAPYNKVDPEKLSAFEVGYKYAGSRFRFDTSAYYYDYKDLQVSALQIVNGTNQAVTTNAAKAEIYGVEAQASGAVTDNLNARASVAYNHARFKEFIAAGINIPSATTGLNSTSCPNPAPPPATRPCTQNQAGQQLVRAPDWTFNLGGDYTYPLEGGAALLASANVAYTSNFATAKSDIGLNGSGLRYGQGGGYALVNITAGWRTPDQTLTVTAYGNNITDKRYYLYRTGNAFGDYHVLGEPATWGVRADYRF